MVMTVTATESGSVFYTKRPGAVLDAGSIIATLELDDASLVTKAQLYKGPFPELEVSHPVASEKLNHIHNSYKAVLENTLAGNIFDVGFLSIFPKLISNHYTSVFSSVCKINNVIIS